MTAAPPAATQPVEPQPVDSVRPFQPGVSIDWRNHAVLADAQVVLVAGPLEFLACFPGKEHESVLRFEASAAHVYMALGLVGLQPGRPPRWDEDRQRYLPPEGDLVDVWIEFEVEGRTRRVNGFDWLLTTEYSRPPVERPWIFAGSKPLPDGGLAADRTGEGLAVVDMPNCLLALSRSHVSRNDDLWAEANTAAIPPVHTKVRVILTPVAPRTPNISVDFRGAIEIDGRFADAADLADVLLLNCRMNPDSPPEIKTKGVLQADLDNLRNKLLGLGVPVTALRFRASAPASAPTRDQPSSQSHSTLPP